MDRRTSPAKMFIYKRFRHCAYIVPDHSSNFGPGHSSNFGPGVHQLVVMNRGMHTQTWFVRVVGRLSKAVHMS